MVNMAATILIIEVDRDTGRLADYLLRVSGYETRHQPHAVDDAGAMLNCDADLILCDLDALESKGFGVMEKLRRDPRWRDVPAVGLTRRHKPDDHAKMKAAGFANYLHKPIEPEIFVSQVERLLPARLRRAQPLSS
jgi:CheY-like chemotaxis protein